MPVLYAQVERLRVSRDRLVRLRNRVELSPPPPEDLPRNRDWAPREILAHIDEMLPYWMGETERIIAASPAEEPVPFGRTPVDLIRTLTVDRDRYLPINEMYLRLDNWMERTVRRLLELDERQCGRRGSHKSRGEMTVKQIVDDMLVAHLEEHCGQMDAALDRTATAAQA